MADDTAAPTGSAATEAPAEAGSWSDVFELIGGLLELLTLFA